MLWLPAAGICIAEPATALVVAGVRETSGADVAPSVVVWGCDGCVDAKTGLAGICMGSLDTFGVLKPEA